MTLMALISIHPRELELKPLELTMDAPAEKLEVSDDSGEFEFVAPIKIHVTFQRLGTDVMATGTLGTRVRSHCSRCLEPAEMELAVKVDELWMKPKPDEVWEQDPYEFDRSGPTIHPMQGDTIEADELFRELVLSELPDRPLCSEDCKGLCPECGGNRNKGECKCHVEGLENAKLPDWKQKLKGLKLDDSEGS